MTTFAPKTYQQQVLDSVETYSKACHELPSPSIAFTATIERLWGRGNPYNPLPGFPADTCPISACACPLAAARRGWRPRAFSLPIRIYYAPSTV